MNEVVMAPWVISAGTVLVTLLAVFYYRYKVGALTAQLEVSQIAAVNSKQYKDRLEAVLADAKAKADKEAEQDAKKADTIHDANGAADWLNGLH